MLLSQNHIPTRGAAHRPSYHLRRWKKWGWCAAARRPADFDLARLIERLHLDDGGAMVAADPEYRPLGGAIYEHAPDIGGARQEIVHDLPRGGVEPRHLVGFFLNDPAPTEIYTLSLHDALPI